MVVMLMVMALGFSGCEEKQIDVSDVKDADAYKSLETEYNELNRKYDKLKSKYNKLKDSSDVDEASDYDVISSIGKATFVKMKCQANIDDNGANEADSSEGDSLSGNNTTNDNDFSEMYVDNSVLLKDVKDSLRNAILDTKTKVSVLNGKGANYYTYVLFKDDNSILTFKVYSNDRVVFDDLPKKVFYSEGISRIGRAYYGTGDKSEIPDLTLAQRVYSSDLCFIEGELASADGLKSISKKLSSGIKKELGEAPIDIDYETLVNVEVRISGKQYMIEMYDRYVRVKYNDKEQWYLCK